MKKLLQVVLLFIVIGTTPAASPSPISTEAKVYVCVGGSAYAYHSNRDCRGLNNCRHEIIEVTVTDAIKKYRRKECRICYR